MDKIQKKRKIIIVTPGRSHLLDTAKQLIMHGYDVRFYTAVSKSRCEKFGLPRENVVSFFIFCAPLMFIFKKIKLPRDINRFVYYLVCRLVDFLTSVFLGKCEVIISISGCSIKAVKKAKKKYNTLFFCDRGAKHILSQDMILRSIPKSKQVYGRDIPIELEQYELADKIILPSSHSYESFILNGISKDKLFVNPYGVQLEMFYPQPEVTKVFDLIFVGNWSLQKGVDILCQAVNSMDIKLLHVGSIGDYPFPSSDKFVHVDPVDQKELVNYYNKAKVLVLPSRQDGFGLVLFQALACGLSLVYSHDTGGPDLRKMISCENRLIEMKSYSVEDLKKSILEALDIMDGNLESNLLCDSDKEEISWDGYGMRYDDFIKSIMG